MGIGLEDRLVPVPKNNYRLVNLAGEVKYKQLWVDITISHILN